MPLYTVPLCRLFIRLLYIMVYAGFMSCAYRLALCQYDASGGSTMHIDIRINKAACRHELPKCANVILAILGAAGGLPPSRTPTRRPPMGRGGLAEEKGGGGQRSLPASPPSRSPRLPEPLAALPRPEFHRFPGGAKDPSPQSALCGLMFLLYTGLCGHTWGSFPPSLVGWLRGCKWELI